MEEKRDVPIERRLDALEEELFRLHEDVLEAEKTFLGYLLSACPRATTAFGIQARGRPVPPTMMMMQQREQQQQQNETTMEEI